MKYKLIGSHPEDTAEGAVVAPGETTPASFDPEHLHNKRLIDEGLLIEVGDEVEPDATDAAKELAGEHNIPLTAVTGTGSGGQIIKSDVEQYITESGKTMEEG